MRNPIRRSRKIGLTQGGRVKGGRAYEKWSRVFTQDIWAKLSESDLKWQFLVENPSRDYYHPCSTDEIEQVLKLLPGTLTENIRAIVLRRLPKLDEQRGVEARKIYHCIILNSFPRSRKYYWDRKPEMKTFHHFDHWCKNWYQKNDQWILEWRKEEIKRYYLYHLLLHEVGHFSQPEYFSRKKREDFAENFALTWAQKLGQL